MMTCNAMVNYQIVKIFTHFAFTYHHSSRFLSIMFLSIIPAILDVSASFNFISFYFSAQSSKNKQDIKDMKTSRRSEMLLLLKIKTLTAVNIIIMVSLPCCCVDRSTMLLLLNKLNRVEEGTSKKQT